MSTRQMGQYYTSLTSGRGGGGGQGADLFGLQSKRRLKEAQGLSDIQLKAAKELEAISHAYEIELQELKTKQLEALDNNKTLNAFFEKNNIAKDSPQANTVKEQIMTSQSLDLSASNSFKTGKPPDQELSTVFKEESDRNQLANLRAREVDNASKLKTEVGANTIGNIPSVPGVNTPPNAGNGLLTTMGPLESRTATEVGGLQLPPSKAFPQGFTMPGKPVVNSTYSPGRNMFPIDPNLMKNAPLGPESNDGVLKNNTNPNSDNLTTTPDYEAQSAVNRLMPPLGMNFKGTPFSPISPPVSPSPISTMPTMSLPTPSSGPTPMRPMMGANAPAPMMTPTPRTSSPMSLMPPTDYQNPMGINRDMSGILQLMRQFGY